MLVEPYRTEFHNLIVRARELYPNEDFFYDLGGKMSVDEYMEYLRQRIDEYDEIIEGEYGANSNMEYRTSKA